MSHVEVSLAEHGRDVTSLARATELVAELLGPARAIEAGGWPGSWLVTLTQAEWDELRASGCLTRSSGTAELTAEAGGDMNEDWPKTRTWDLGFSTLAGLFGLLGVTGTGPDRQRAALLDFMNLPAWGPAPDQLKHEAAEWLARTGTGR